jgi:CubicO group peptidase (beta-lactamase class C family)
MLPSHRSLIGCFRGASAKAATLGAQLAASDKEGITVRQVITHQGGFPNSDIC